VNEFSVDTCYYTTLTQVMKHTISIIRKLERGNSVLDVDIEDVVIFLSLVKLLAS
jgi:hypothetical protein